MTARYLNTDLDVASASDLGALAAALEARGLLTLHVSRAEDLSWCGRFEIATQFQDPEDTIAAMLDVIEGLSALLSRDWEGCAMREFNIGFACGEAGPFESRLSHQLISRIAKAGGRVGISIYAPDRSAAPSPQGR